MYRQSFTSSLQYRPLPAFLQNEADGIRASSDQAPGAVEVAGTGVPVGARYGEPVPAVTASDPAYRLYAWWLRRHLHRVTLPRHVALIMDGNRRWARAHGHLNPSVGHRYGAEHVADVLGWCSDLGIRHVTVWVASADNIRKRDSDEVAFLMRVAEDVVAARLGRPGGGWRVHVAGQPALLPDSTVHALKRACDATVGETRHGDLTVAIGYSGRQEIVD